MARRVPLLVALFALTSLLLLTVGCAPTPVTSARQDTLPTLVPSPLPDALNMDGAERTARLFLEAWTRGDYPAMHALTTFASQDATPLADFTLAYEDAAATLTLAAVRYQGLAMAREHATVAAFTYDATFDTLVLGTFTDAGRTLHLVFDAAVNDWRVAWSLGDIFAELGAGGALRLERVVPNRANIYDRNGTVLADQNGRMVAALLVPNDVPAREACLDALSTAANLPREVIVARFEAAGGDWLAEMGLLEPTAYTEWQTVLERDCGATFEGRAARRYPLGTLAPHIVGHVGFAEEAELPALAEAGFDQDAIIGRSGVERAWDTTLRGTPGGTLSIVQGDVTVRTIASSPPVPAQSVWLTLDANLQQRTGEILARAYADAASSWGPGSRGAAAVVMDPQTGAILALVSYPTFDGNVFNPYPAVGRQAAQAAVRAIGTDPRTPQLNRPVQGTYPSGSVMKIATALAAVDSGVYAPDESYSCYGTWSREDGFTRYDWNAGHGTWDVAGGLANSCNPYFYEAGFQMDATDPFLMPRQFNRFGLGMPSGLTDIETVPGNIPNPDYVEGTLGLPWSASRAVNMAIGQDLDVTPLQITGVTAIVANGGTLIRPRLVGHTGLIGDPPSNVLTPEGDALGLMPDALRVVAQGMCDVTTQPYGTAEFQFHDHRLQGIGVCGKTGTAQAPGETALSHAWFTAYAPPVNPEVVVTVLIENSGEGSGVAAPIARDILDYYFFDMPDPSVPSY